MKKLIAILLGVGLALGGARPAMAQQTDVELGSVKGPGALPTLPIPGNNPFPEGPMVVKPLAPGEMPYYPGGTGSGFAPPPQPTTGMTGGASVTQRPLFLERNPEPGNAFYGTGDNGLFFQSFDRNWLIHVGGRFQFTAFWWNQPIDTRGSGPGNGGIPAATAAAGNGVGRLDDGMFFRRARFRSDGVGYGTIEYVMEVNFEQLNYITFDHMWAGFKDVPFLGTVRIGQHKVPQGLEMMGSDFHLTFLERSSLSDAFWTLFAPGIFVANDAMNQQITYQTMIHRIQPVGIYTNDFGDGNYAWTSRVTWNPLYENDGAQVVHLGASCQWRQGDLGRSWQPGATGIAFADTQSVLRYRARPELRDASGISSTLGGETARFVDTGYLLASNASTFSPEFLWINGPLSIQAEGAWVHLSRTQSVFPGSAFRADRGNPSFWGGYVQASYFLTGEHRGYDRRFGVFDRPVLRNRFQPKSLDGQCDECATDRLSGSGWGAWEVAYRYSFLDLNDRGLNGGQMAQQTLGINWYFNDNFKLQLQYSNIHRDVILPAQSGTIHGLGLMTQWYF